MKKIKAIFVVKGLVQMVGFRYFTKINARELNLYGYAKNLCDSSVQIVVEGNENDIAELKARLKKGPSRSNVSDVECDYHDFSGEYKEFYIY